MVTIDTGMFDSEGATAAYLIEGCAPVLVDAGAATNRTAIIEAIEQSGTSTLSAIVLTHIHLDHAGGAGHLAERFPEATIYIHERMAKHLVDPSRVVAGSRHVWGNLFGSYFGPPLAISPARIAGLEPGDRIPAGDGSLIAIDTPGHTRAHLSFLDDASGDLFCGDALGIQLDGSKTIRPASPPSDFDLDAAVRSIRVLADLAPASLRIGHFGKAEPSTAEACEMAIEALVRWSEAVDEALIQADNTVDVVRLINAALDAGLEPVTPRARARFETVNPAWLNVAGLSAPPARQSS